MSYKFSFQYGEKQFPATVLFSMADEPYFLFTTLEDEQLINDFGKEITIQTDAETVVHLATESAELSALKDAMFLSLKNTIAFKEMTNMYGSRRDYQRKLAKKLAGN